jgi:hypothetical protein
MVQRANATFAEAVSAGRAEFGQGSVVTPDRIDETESSHSND